MKIGIVGNGFVGQATALFQCNDVEVLMYDVVPEKCFPKDVTLEKLAKECELVFVCVPTPMISKNNPRCDTTICTQVVNDLRTYNQNVSIVIRSTTPVGYCKSMNVHHFPEFLTEKNWETDFRHCENWIVGLHQENAKFKSQIRNLIHLAHSNNCILHNNVHFTTSNGSELVKYSRNCFLAVKVSFFNEIEEFSRKNNINYNEIRELITLDDRIGPSHTKVPNNGQRGWGGVCFPKDTLNLVKQYEDFGIKSFVIQAAYKRNVTVDRPNKEWEKAIGRSISHV